MNQNTCYKTTSTYNVQFHLRELKVVRVGAAIVFLDTTFPCSPYVKTLKAMQFNEAFSAVPIEDLQSRYVLVSNLSSLQDAAEQLH